MYIETLETLSHVAGRIAEGGYSLRSNILTEDEVGALSRSFDRMADTVEENISRLEKTNKNQQLLIGALTHELKTPMTAIIGIGDYTLQTEKIQFPSLHLLTSQKSRATIAYN